METIVLGTEAARISIGDFVQQIGPDGVEIRDSEGRLMGVVLPPQHLLAATTAIQYEWEFGKSPRILELGGDIEAAMQRRGGKSTQQLLETLNAIPLPLCHPRAQ